MIVLKGKKKTINSLINEIWFQLQQINIIVYVIEINNNFLRSNIRYLLKFNLTSWSNLSIIFNNIKKN